MKKKILKIKKKKIKRIVKKARNKKRKNLRKGKIRQTRKRENKKAGKLKIKKSGKQKSKKVKSPQPWGVITHYYGKIGVAIVKLNSDIMKGVNVSIIGATTNFTQVIDSMQADHQEIDVAKRGQEIGIKVKDRVREGDELFSA